MSQMKGMLRRPCWELREVVSMNSVRWRFDRFSEVEARLSLGRRQYIAAERDLRDRCYSAS